MPISIDDFEYAGDSTLDIRGENKLAILRFLLENDDQAFTAREIGRATDVHENSINPVLSRLHAWGLVRHRGRYWAIAEDDRLAGLAGAHFTTKAANEEYGVEDKDEWLEHAGDDKQ